MAPIVVSVEISRSPAGRLRLCHGSVAPALVGGERREGGQRRCAYARRHPSRRCTPSGSARNGVGRRGRRVSTTDALGVCGVDGPVRGDVTGTIEPLDRGTRSRVTLNLELKGHGIGKLLLQLVVQRQAKKEMPQNAQNLKATRERRFSHRLMPG